MINYKEPVNVIASVAVVRFARTCFVSAMEWGDEAKRKMKFPCGFTALTRDLAVETKHLCVKFYQWFPISAKIVFATSQFFFRMLIYHIKLRP